MDVRGVTNHALLGSRPDESCNPAHFRNTLVAGRRSPRNERFAGLERNWEQADGVSNGWPAGATAQVIEAAPGRLTLAVPSRLLAVIEAN